jgi:acyl-CoA dehydrogenase
MGLPIQRSIFSPEHELFRATVRRFMETELAPHMSDWWEQGHVDREVWRKAGDAGLLCVTIPEAYGGGGADRKYSAVIIEEQARINTTAPAMSMHSEIVAPYIDRYGSEQQKQRWLSKMASGELVGALGMSEPGTGSDLQNIRTTAIRQGDEFVVNGSKTFITNGYLAGLVVVAAKTDPAEGAKGMSLLVVETDRDGFRAGKPLKKIGQRATDTSELFFDDVRVPADNLLGVEGQGFAYLMQELAWERLITSIRAVESARFAVDETIRYAKERKAFGRSVIEFQNSKFKLAECKTKVQIARVYIDKCIELASQGDLDNEASAMAKYWSTEMQNEVIDQCLQLHGGYGYMMEYPIATAFLDARVQPIYAGTNEIMKEIIARNF